MQMKSGKCGLAETPQNKTPHLFNNKKKSQEKIDDRKGEEEEEERVVGDKFQRHNNHLHQIL